MGPNRRPAVPTATLGAAVEQPERARGGRDDRAGGNLDVRALRRRASGGLDMQLRGGGEGGAGTGSPPRVGPGSCPGPAGLAWAWSPAPNPRRPGGNRRWGRPGAPVAAVGYPPGPGAPGGGGGGRA